MNFHSVFSFLFPSSLLSFSYFCYKRTETERNKTHGKIEKYHGFHHPPPSPPSLFPFLRKMVTDRIGDLLIHPPCATTWSGLCASLSGFLLFPPVCVSAKDCCVWSAFNSSRGTRHVPDPLFVLTQRCFSGLSLWQCVCVQCVCLFILMMRVHPTAWLHHSDLSLLLSVDFILQPEAFVSSCSWAHMITFSAVQAQKWGSWATGYVNFEIHSIFAYVF